MEEATIDPKHLEDAVLKALPTLFPHLLGTTSSAPVEFYDKFQREADERDSDFVKKYGEDLDTTPISAGLFSAVTSAFIVDVESQLQPDFTKSSYIMLTILANISLGHPPADLNSVLPSWNGPDPTIVHVEAILYASLAASLLAAFVAMLGKQWLSRYTQVEMRGSIIDRNRHRLRKMNGMVTWHFDLVMESLPLMLQAALLLLGYALSNYLFTIDRVVAGVVIGFTAFGLLFYLLIVSAATLSYNCPFQTPLSLIIRFMVRFDDEHKKYLRRARKWFGRMPSFFKKRPRQKSTGPYTLGGFNPFEARVIGDPIELAIAGAADPQAPLFNEETDWDGYVLDSNCITWMFEKSEMSMDADVILPTMGFISEVVWHAGIRTTPLEGVYNVFLECFDHSSRYPKLKPKLRNKAYLSAKALLHLVIQRQCIGHEPDRAVIASISDRYSTMAFECDGGDPDLESTLRIMDSVFCYYEWVPWHTFSFSAPHHAWMAHILLCRAWDVLRKGKPLPDTVKEFVLYSLHLEPPPPAPIVTDCIFIIGLVLGIELHIDDLLVIDKSRELRQQLNRVYKRLLRTFKNPIPTAGEIYRALEAMELIAPLSGNNVTMSCHLFHVVMQAPISETYTQEKKWKASRFAMRGADKWRYTLPLVEDLKVILPFLDHHFNLATRWGGDYDEPIRDALRALAYASGPVAIEALKNFDPTEPSFVQGICYIFEDGRPAQLRKAALLFLPLIGDKWFNTTEPIMKPNQMRSLCVDWASAVDGVEHTLDVQKATLAVLFGMINSSCWRPHIVTEKWKLLEYFTSVPDDSQPLKRCLDNLELTDAISKVGNPVAMFVWLEILWLKYNELVPEVQKQLEAVTRGVASSKRRTDLETYMSVMDSELAKAESALGQRNTGSVGPAAFALRMKIHNLHQAKITLLALKRG